SLDGRERVADARLDLVRRRADVLEPERDLGADVREDDLVLGVLEQRRHDTGELSRPVPPRVASGHIDPAREAAAVEVWDEPRESTQERRLPTPGRPEHDQELPRLDGQRDVTQRRLAGYGIGIRQSLCGR